MYTILENARIVIALLKEHNIRHIVLSPGGSNIPIVQGVQQDPFFTCYSVVDERSAMYFAIGLYLQLGVPVATSCTSAQATRNYIPGLTEAFYKHVPILAITMSKHPRYLRQDYMQCPIQTSLPVDAVKCSYSLPYISNENDRAQCIRTANEAILELTRHSPGPVQLNIEELDNETWEFGTNNLPEVRSIKRLAELSNEKEKLIGKKIMLLIGEHRPFHAEIVEAIERFSKKYDVFIYAHHISNYHGKYSLNANIVASTISQKLFDKRFAPDILITIGGITGDYGIYFKLFNSKKAIEHWRIDEDGRVVDTYNKLTRIYEMSAMKFFSILSDGNDVSPHTYYELWKRHLDEADIKIDIPFSNAYAAQKLHDKIPANSKIFFAILNSLRTWGYFQLRNDITCFSNVAAFGIDGCLSTMLGASVSTTDKTFLVTGDLAFFYDMNALGIRHIRNNVRILLVNNNGGAEFKLGSLEEKTDVSSYIAADNHFKNAKGWAETNGFIYLSANNKNDFDRTIDRFIADSEKPILFEIFTSAANERIANRNIIRTNWKGDNAENIKNTTKDIIRGILGEDLVNKIKKHL